MEVLRSRRHNIYRQYLDKVSLVDSKFWIAEDWVGNLAYAHKYDVLNRVAKWNSM